MTTNITRRKERHLSFLQRRNIRPLIGCIEGWENLSRYVKNTEDFLPKGNVPIDALTPDRLLSMYENADVLKDHDDLIRTVEPYTFVPWIEAALGCAVEYTGKNVWSSPVEQTKTPRGRSEWMQTMLAGGMQNQSRKWIEKYETLLAVLANRFGAEHPVGQAILRGPLDTAGAVFGDEAAIYLFFDEPDLMRRFLDMAAKIFQRFVEAHQRQVPPFAGGTVLGSYYLWTPGSAMRLQEDAMALLSPDLYREFVHPVDCALASRTECTLFHMHATGLHLLDVLLQNDGLDIIQVSKDEGVPLGPIIPKLRRIQDAEKCLVIKGRFNEEEIANLKTSLDPHGLCIQGVVLDSHEADAFMQAFD